MQWIEVKVVFDQPGNDPADRELAADLISDIFYDFGLQGVVVEDPGIAPEEDWAEDAVGRAVSHSVTAYLPEDSQLETRCRTLEKKLSLLETQSGLISRISYKTRDDEPDTNITTAEQIVAAWDRIDNFLAEYQDHLKRLGLSLE